MHALKTVVLGRLHPGFLLTDASCDCFAQPVVYMLFHFLLSGAAAVTSCLCWHSFHYHTVFVLLMLLGAAWNGSNFYFSHFAFKYVKRTGLDKLHEKKA